MDRTEKLISYIDKEGLGLEIGPFHSPIAPKSKGFNTKILDAATKEELDKRWNSIRNSMDIKTGSDTNSIEDVDYIWQGGSMRDVVGEVNLYHWIISSHSIEHSTNLVEFLQDSEEMLTDGGRLVLAVPDKRYTFDFLRETTGIREIINDYYRLDNSKHTLGTCYETYALMSTYKNLEAWGMYNKVLDPDQISLKNINTNGSDLDSKLINDRIDLCKNSESYIDSHNGIFTPYSFGLIVKQLKMLGYINFSIKVLEKTIGDHEFLVVLEKGGSQTNYDNMTLLDFAIMSRQDDIIQVDKMPNILKMMQAFYGTANNEISDIETSSEIAESNKINDKLSDLYSENTVIEQSLDLEISKGDQIEDL